MAEFSSFANFEEGERKSNLLVSFPKVVHQKGFFWPNKKKIRYFASVGRFWIFSTYALKNCSVRHSTLAVNNLIRFKVCFAKCVIKSSCLSPGVFVALSICRLRKFA